MAGVQGVVGERGKAWDHDITSIGQQGSATDVNAADGSTECKNCVLEALGETRTGTQRS